MIKQSLLNFFKNLKYVFTPLGTMFLGILFGIFFLYSGFQTQLNKVTTEIVEITQESSISIDGLTNCVVDSILTIPWNEPFDAIKTITSKDWIENTLIKNIENEIDSYIQYAQDIENTIVSAINGYSIYINLFIICFLMSLLFGFILTKFLIRRKIVKHSFIKYLLISFADAVNYIALAVFCMWLFTLWKPSIFISIGLIALLYSTMSLFLAYLKHSHGRFKIKNVVNIKNVILMILADLLIIALCLILATILTLLTNNLVGLFISLALIQIAFIVINLNADIYVKTYIQTKEKFFTMQDMKLIV